MEPAQGFTTGPGSEGLCRRISSLCCLFLRQCRASAPTLGSKCRDLPGREARGGGDPSGGPREPGRLEDSETGFGIYFGSVKFRIKSIVK